MEMQEEEPKYHFRRRDYTKIRSWYDFTKQNYIPSDLPQLEPAAKSLKLKQWYFRFSFKELLLTQLYVNSNMKKMFRISRLVFLSSLFNKREEKILSYGREISLDCEFDVNDLRIVLKQVLLLFFFIETNDIKDYQLCFQIQMINHQGELYKLGASRYPLFQRKDADKDKVMLIFNNLFVDKDQQEELQTLSTVQYKNKVQKLIKGNVISEDKMVGKIQFELDSDQIKEIKKYLPPFRIIDKSSQVAPTSFNLKKKKDQLLVDPSYDLILKDLIFKIEHPQGLNRQILDNNPFTLSHKDNVLFQIKEFKVILDNHNGWKFMKERKNHLKLELVISNVQEIYISSKTIHNVPLHYYESDLVVLVMILTCKVQFLLKGVTQQKRTKQFIVGWLPLPLDLSQKQNKIQLKLVNDIEFPTQVDSLLGVQTIINTSIIHNLYQKYKSKQEQKKIFTDHLLIDTMNISESSKYLKLRSIRQITDSISSESELKNHQFVESQFRGLKQLIMENELKKLQQKYIKVHGRPQLGQLHHQNQSMLPLKSTVGKFLKVKIQIDSLVPQTNSPSLFYLPKKMTGTIYFLRENHTMQVNINEREGRFHVPIRLNPQKTCFTFTLHIDSVQQFQKVMNSRFIITFYEEDDEKLYAKGVTSAHDILGAVQADQYAYVNIFKWTEIDYKILGTLLVNVSVQVERKQGRNAIEEVNVNKVIEKLPPEQRIKMRIGCFKGDQEMKNQAVSYLKKKQHNKYVESVVMQSLHCDAELQYQIGKDAYCLLGFLNQNKSDVNNFTFHLNCPYAELITSQKEYRQIMSELNVQQLGFHYFSFNLQDPLYLSYYEATLRFNQQVGILIRLNVNQYEDNREPLSKLEVVVKRNTIQAKRYMIKCKYKEPMIYDVFYDYGLLEQQEESSSKEIKINIPSQVQENYKDIQILNKNIIYNSKTKEITVNKTANKIKILILARPFQKKQTEILIYHLLMLPGQKISLFAGQPKPLSLELVNKTPIQILKCHDKEVTILNVVKFHQKEYNKNQDLLIQALRPYQSKNFIFGAYDLSGVRLSQYLIKVDSKLPIQPSQMELIFDQSATYSLCFDNPYPCPCQFTIVNSSQVLNFQEKNFKIEGYGSKVILFDLKHWQDKNIYVYLLDLNGNACQIIQLLCKLPQLVMEDEEK